MTGQDIQSLPTPSWILSFLVKFRQIPGKVILKYFFSLSLWPLKFRGWVCGVLKKKYINVSILSNYSFLLLSKCMYHFNGFIEANVLYYGLTYYAILLPWMFTFDESVSGYICHVFIICIVLPVHTIFLWNAFFSCFYLSVAVVGLESPPAIIFLTGYCLNCICFIVMPFNIALTSSSAEMQGLHHEAGYKFLSFCRLTLLSGTMWTSGVNTLDLYL